MRLSEGNALQFAITTALAMGCEILGHTQESNLLAVRHGANNIAIDIASLFTLDKETARHTIEHKIKSAGIPETRWSPYVNHSVLIRKYPGMAIENVRVDAISPSGKYVRFMDLLNNRFFWSPVEDYDLLEDLGVRVITHPVKPVAPPSRMVQTPLN